MAQAGFKVIVLERRAVVGGLSTDYEFSPGYHASIPNSPGSLEPKIVADLALKEFGLEFKLPDPSLVVPFPDGRAMVAWRDPEQTAQEIAKFSKKDAVAYSKLFEFLNDFARRIKVSLFEPPPRLRDIVTRLETPEDEAAFAEIVLGSIKDLLDRRIESDELKAVIAAISVTSNLVGPQTPGSAYLMLMRPLSLASSSIESKHDPRNQYLRGSTGLPVGGMGSVTRAMRRSLEAFGGVVRTECAVTRIEVDQGRVLGVELDGEEFIRAPIVV